MTAESGARRPSRERRGAARFTAFACCLYLVLTIALTWPLAASLARNVPGDFGDPLFASWVMAWDATHLGRGWWNANIFAPHPLALAYSEHFLPQGLQALPIYWLTRNPILGYNVVFLSTFVLSGLGMFLLGRELTGSRVAGLVAGLAFAFTPYRVASLSHLQVLSAAWMPFVLYGLRRYFSTGRTRPLAGAVAAWIVQNLSCGYYLLFFSPVVLLYMLWELTTRAAWRNKETLLHLIAASAIVAAVTGAFLLPYLELRRLGFSPRSLAETKRFSADVYAYLTADPNLRVWGRVADAFPRAEGLLFPGLTVVALATVAVTRSFANRTARSSGSTRGRVVAVAGGIVAVVVVTLLLGWQIRLPGIKITELSRVLIVAIGGAVIVFASSHRSRTALMRWLVTPSAFFLLVTLFAIAMSFGPEVRAKGRTVTRTSVYLAFYNFAPGFDGVRVPARFAMVATLGLATLAAFGVKAIEARVPWLAVLAGALIVVEAVAVPIQVNENSTEYQQQDLAALPAAVAVGSSTPDVYRYVARLPASAIVLELPLGEPAFDVRYMFYSTTHWKRLVNGYSGGAPPEYESLTGALKDADTQPDRAWQAVKDSAATHVVVHEGSYQGDRGARLSDWLRTRGATEVAKIATDRLFELR